MSKIKTLFIVGPTASGKTALSIRLAEKFGGEIVSADSMQIYKGIHIASAAPDVQEMQGIPHHLLEFLEPQDCFSVADYVKAARDCISDISSRGKLPIVVGGTGLYISSLADNIGFNEEKTDLELRQSLEKRFDEIGAKEMLKELADFDPESAARLHPNNRRRIIRAFEVYKLTGKTITEQNILSKKGEKLIEPCMIGINFRDREKLYERINRRVDIMLKSGLLDEAKKAYQRKNGGAFQAIGHKELFGVFEGKCILDEAAENLKRQTRRYAKRQLTWFNRDDRINWLYADDNADIFAKAAEIAENFIKKEGTL